MEGSDRYRARLGGQRGGESTVGLGIPEKGRSSVWLWLWVWLAGQNLVFVPGSEAQQPAFAYQVILETQAVYQAIREDSPVNPGNAWGLEAFTSVARLYPVLQFAHRFGQLDSKLQLEGLIRNDNLAKDSTRFSFQELYTQFSIADNHYFVAGKKRLDWGTGAIWNPTNFYIRKDPLRPQNRLDGIFMLSYAYLRGNGSWNLYLFPAREKENTAAAFRYEYTAARFDVALSFVEQGNDQQFGYEMAYGGDYFTAYSEGAVRSRTKAFHVGAGGAGIPPGERKRRYYGEWVGGMTYSLDSHFSLSAEYRYRGDYPGRGEIARYKQFLPANPLVYDPLGIGRHTLFGNASWRDTYGKWSAQVRVFGDPVSGQWVVSPLGVWTMNNFQIELSGMWYAPSWQIYRFQGSALLSYFF